MDKRKQEIRFAVEIRNGVVTRIGRSEMFWPRVEFCGGSVKWLEDSRQGKRRGREPVEGKDGCTGATAAAECGKNA